MTKEFWQTLINDANTELSGYDMTITPQGEIGNSNVVFVRYHEDEDPDEVHDLKIVYSHQDPISKQHMLKVNGNWLIGTGFDLAKYIYV